MFQCSALKSCISRNSFVSGSNFSREHQAHSGRRVKLSEYYWELLPVSRAGLEVFWWRIFWCCVLNSYSVRLPKGIIRMFHFNFVILTLQGCCALCKSQNDKARAKSRMKWNFKNFDLQEIFWPHQKPRCKDNTKLFLEYFISLQSWDSDLLFQFEWKLNVELFYFLVPGDIITAVALHGFVNWTYSPTFSNLFILVSTLSQQTTCKSADRDLE